MSEHQIARSRASSDSSPSPNEEKLQITVQFENKLIPLNVYPSNSLSDVLGFLSASTNLPSDAKILLAGRQLQPSETISSLQLEPTSTFEILSALRASSPTEAEAMGETSSATVLPPVQPASQPSPTPTASEPTVKAEPTPQADSAPVAKNAATKSTPTPSTTTSPPTTSTPHRRKPRCAHPPCKAPAQPITGDCGFCQQRFCSKHRMLESHACEGLEDAKQVERDRNRRKLENERTVMVRGL